MREVIRGTYTSLIFSMFFALVVLLFTSGNVLITVYAMLTIIFIIADTVAVFVLCGWELNILETIIIIMSVGLSVDFSKTMRSLRYFSCLSLPSSILFTYVVVRV
jgi:predicted RND superfamily exporter protein